MIPCVLAVFSSCPGDPLQLQLLGDFVPQTLYRGFAPGPHLGTFRPRYWPLFFLGPSGGNSPHQDTFQKSPPKINETEEPEAQIHALPSRTKSLDFLDFAAITSMNFAVSAHTLTSK